MVLMTCLTAAYLLAQQRKEWADMKITRVICHWNDDGGNIPGETRPGKVYFMLSVVQGNRVIWLEKVNNFLPLTLEVKCGLFSSCYHEGTSLVQLMLHSLWRFFFFSPAFLCVSLSYLSSTLCAHSRFLVSLFWSKVCSAAILFSLIYLPSA